MKQKKILGWAAVRLVALILIVMTSSITGCAGPAAADLVQSSQPRKTAGDPEALQVQELARSQRAFALDLHQQLYDEDQNLLASPYSLSLALAMSYAGARGQTEQQMAEALHFELPQAQLHPALNALDQSLGRRTADQDRFQLQVANAIWGQRDHPFSDPFLDTLAENYGAGLRTADWSQPEEARRTINQWVRDQTEQRIQELLPAGAIDRETALVLANAIAFRAPWMHPFDQNLTRDDAFTLPGGDQIMVPTMHQSAELGVAQRPGLQAVALPYAGGELSMVILLPEAGRLEALVSELDVGLLDGILDELQPAQVSLALPRFSFASSMKLKEPLMALGMVDAFREADFSGIDGSAELFIRQVYHTVVIEVDEAGTEASGSAAVVMARKGPAPAAQEIKINRPFLFLIRDQESGAVLFLGQVVNPTQQ